jgi:hypothetical protein
VSKVDPDSTGLNPAWRKALAHVDWSKIWDEGASASEIDQVRAALAKTLGKLSTLTGSSAYFNEVPLLICGRNRDAHLDFRHTCLSPTQSTPSLVIITTN